MKKYRWEAYSNDGFTDSSNKSFDTEKEAYNDMRDNVLEKMKWNTEYDEDFTLTHADNVEYKVIFQKDRIVHESFSGVYTYEIVEDEYQYILSDTDNEKGWDYSKGILTAFKDKKSAVDAFLKRWDEIIGEHFPNNKEEYAYNGNGLSITFNGREPFRFKRFDKEYNSHYLYVESDEDNWNELWVFEIPLK